MFALGTRDFWEPGREMSCRVSFEVVNLLISFCIFGVFRRVFADVPFEPSRKENGV